MEERTIERFRTEWGVLLLTPVDWNLVNRIESDYKEENPRPTVPVKERTLQNIGVKMARMAAEMARRRRMGTEEAELEVLARETGKGREEAPHAFYEDPKDEEYARALYLWEAEKFTIVESLLLSHSILYELSNERKMTLVEVVAEDSTELLVEALNSNTASILERVRGTSDRRAEFFTTLRGVSLLTWERVEEAGRELGMTRSGVPILEVHTGRSGESQPMQAIAKMSAIDNGVDPFVFQQWPIQRRADFVALDLSKKWQSYWQNHDAQKEAEAMRRAQQ